jgi:GNAT superfamily N-acetyltransferase
MINKNTSWQDLLPTFERTEESFFNTWDFFEGKFGEFGTPGFSEQILPARFPHIFGHNDELNVKVTLYRGEDGQLLCVVARYFNEENNIEKPFIFDVHPDYQRQGIGTKVADYVFEQIKDEAGEDFDYPKSWENIDLTLASANFANKYVKKFN